MGDVEALVENDLIYLKFSSQRVFEILDLNILVPTKENYEIIFLSNRMLFILFR